MPPTGSSTFPVGCGGRLESPSKVGGDATEGVSGLYKLKAT